MKPGFQQNMSLAAPSFKRRMLGLAVTDPFERTP